MYVVLYLLLHTCSTDQIDSPEEKQQQKASVSSDMQRIESIDFKLLLIDEKRQVLGTQLVKYSGNPESLLLQLDSVSMLLTRLEKEFVVAFPQLNNVKSFHIIFTGKSCLMFTHITFI